MTIPKGKRVIIKKGNQDLLPPHVILTTDEAITISLSSKFDSFLDTSLSKHLVAISKTVKSLTNWNVPGAFKEMGYQQWSGTDPIKFSFSTTLNMKTSGRKDVVEPAIILAGLCLPTSTEASWKSGFGLVAPGPSIIAAMGKESKYEDIYSFRCGVFYLPNVIIEKAEPTFAKEYDDEGFPISCTITMDVTSLFTATTNDLDRFLQG